MQSSFQEKSAKMNHHQRPPEVIDISKRPVLDCKSLIFGAAFLGFIAFAALSGYWFGRSQEPASIRLFPRAAATADSSDSMAMATGLISEDMEGVFFIDFNTGDLQCLVYYPRARAFGAHYYTNVRAQLGGIGKNSKYLLGTGFAAQGAATIGPRPGGSLVYVTDVNTGMFAAYAIPWDRNAEVTGRAQSGPLVYVGGGPIRNYQLANPPIGQPPAVVDPNINKNP